MDLSSLILVLEGYDKIFYLVKNDRGSSQNELTIQKCIEFANRKIERVSLIRDEKQFNVLIEFKKEQSKEIEVEDYYR